MSVDETTNGPGSSAAEPEESRQVTSVPLLDYGCTPWRLASQDVADMYDSKVKFWTKRNLADIEGQLAESMIRDRFTVRCIRGNELQIKNPVHGARTPIWKPFVKYQDYWHLVIEQPKGKAETYYCTYLINWRNELDKAFRGHVADWTRLFETKLQLWRSSITCDSFKEMFRTIVASRKVSKIVCFGLGDMASRAPELTILPHQRGTGIESRIESDGAEAHGQMMQHATAMTMLEEVRRQNPEARLLSQDPQYSLDTKDFLRSKGYDIVGDFGAGGFAEVDDETVVFSAWVSAPVKQIVADIARPAVFVTLHHDNAIYNTFRKPFADSESPRTREMWKSYERQNFPTSPVEVELMNGLHGLTVFARLLT